MVRLELRQPEGMEGLFTAEPIALTSDRDEAKLRIVAAKDARLWGSIPLTLRATAMQNGKLPVVSETTVELHFGPKS